MATSKPERAAGVGRGGDPNRLSWPLLRSDVVTLFCLAVVAYCLATGTWPGLAIVALVAAVFSALSPRMTGRFHMRLPGAAIGGAFGDTRD